MFEIKEMIFRAVINRTEGDAQAPLAPAATDENKKDDCCCDDEFEPLIPPVEDGSVDPKTR